MLTNNQVLIIIIIACLLIMGVSIIVKKTHLVVDFFIKSVVGLFGIYLINEILQLANVTIKLGLNIINAIIIGLLGFPGIILLYALAVYDYFF
ncbi:sigmaK-factor processing regulatory protein BofA [Natranaerovirga hydrolytica]|uniref:SigmaK-factor processing regulatory protein BofA n=1 Tax=Natranaerovirga hydrolytica TaxID=680378 RepID=A0A4R1N1R1_9FIRM|nr:pro-sigmaK processing inhibitor BofA family protein [Natranaerovirga hydrolytica]TCL00079.1 sigmaK-factor processing regulatory protein BofA [Natranaerovirga hydrolytica]